MKRIVIFLALLLIILPFTHNLVCQDKGKIILSFENLKNDKGHILAALYNNKNGFPQDRSKYFMKGRAEIKDKKAYITFDNVPFGEYAIACFHDENDNQALDKNFFGIPKESYGFSNNPKVMFSAPSYDESKFKHNLTETNLLIKMR